VALHPPPAQHSMVRHAHRHTLRPSLEAVVCPSLQERSTVVRQHCPYRHDWPSVWHCKAGTRCAAAGASSACLLTPHLCLCMQVHS
jgi:hypothetical protein